MRVRSRGLPKNRGLARKCGIMTVAIKRLPVAGGAGERPAKAPSPALCVRFPIAPLWEVFSLLATSTQQKKAHVDRTSDTFWQLLI